MSLNIAYHEAGHAIACLKLGIEFKHITIVPNDENQTLGCVALASFKYDGDIQARDQQRLDAEKYISIALAGPLAEEKFTGIINLVGGTKDFASVFNLAFSLFGNEKTANAFVNFLLLDTASLFTYFDVDHSYDSHLWEEVKVLANELEVSKTLSYDQVLEIFSHYR